MHTRFNLLTLLAVLCLSAGAASAQYYWPPVQVEIRGPGAGLMQRMGERMMRTQDRYRDMAEAFGWPMPRYRIVEVGPPSVVTPPLPSAVMPREPSLLRPDPFGPPATPPAITQPALRPTVPPPPAPVPGRGRNATDVLPPPLEPPVIDFDAGAAPPVTPPPATPPRRGRAF